MGGIALANYGLLAGITETTANTEETPTVGIQVVGQPSYSRDESFNATEVLTLDPDFRAGARVKNKNDLSFNAIVTYMADSATDELPNLAVWEAAGWGVHQRAGTTGSGNFIELRPLPDGFKASTFHGYIKEAAAGKLSRKKHIGTRGNLTLNLTPGAGNVLQADFEGSSKWAFWEAFATVASPPTLDTLAHHKASCWGMTIAGLSVPLISFSASPNFAVTLPGDQVTNCDSGASDIPIEPAAQGGSFSLKLDEDLIASGAGAHIRNAIESDDPEAIVFTRDDGVQLFSLTCPAAVLQAIALGTGDDRFQFDVDFIAQAVSGGDQMTARWEIL